jgi:hypothetical protein
MSLIKRTVGGMALAALMASVPVSAALKANATRASNFTFSGADVLVPLDLGGATSLAFSGSGKFMVSYSAECETQGAWLSIQIIVDGVVLAPTAGVADAFCSDHNNNDSNDAWTTAHYRVVTPALPTGPHTVQVRATVFGGAAGALGWLGDTSILVEK